jgi:ElaB/YqjD/DUF883 family membrane-anchored ribosome-binding protein
MITSTSTAAHTAHEVTDKGADAAHNAVNQVADSANELISKTQSAVEGSEKTIKEGLDTLREAVPATLARASTQAEDLARAGIQKARLAREQMAEQAHRVGDSTVSYVRREPTKALLIAAAAGAAATLLIGWATRERRISTRY